MNRRSLLTWSGLALAAVGGHSRLLAADAGGWQPLWNGRDLQGWQRLGDAAWTVEDGMLTCASGPISYLVSAADYGDFQLRAEFWASENANSGIFIRCTDPANVTPTNAYEVNIFDQRPDPSYATGAIVGVAKLANPPKAGGRWNLMEITADGDRFSVTFNGERTVDNARDSAHAKGRIALQYGAGTLKFRKVDVRRI